MVGNVLAEINAGRSVAPQSDDDRLRLVVRLQLGPLDQRRSFGQEIFAMRFVTRHGTEQGAESGEQRAESGEQRAEGRERGAGEVG